MDKMPFNKCKRFFRTSIWTLKEVKRPQKTKRLAFLEYQYLRTSDHFRSL